MQLAHVTIENFRQFERLELDFTDSLGRVRDVSVLVGPNGSGKTTVLDAIALALGPSTRIPSARAGLVLTPRTIVRKGALHATVTCILRFTPDEIAAAREVYARLELAGTVPENDEEVSLTWTYPDPNTNKKEGDTRLKPGGAWTLLMARFQVARLLGMDAGGKLDAFRHAGRVVTIDQWRTALGKSIGRDVWRIAAGDYGSEKADGDERWTADPRQLLIDLAVKAQIPGPEDDQFGPVKDWYAKICAPRRIVGAVRGDADTLDIRFSDGKSEYGYDGVSSGEAMVLLFLIKLATERIHSSIVLVDELELHQHPVWQRRLLHMLPRMGESNQIIVTTHSSYLRDVMPRGAVHDVTGAPKVIQLGALEDDDDVASGQHA